MKDRLLVASTVLMLSLSAVARSQIINTTTDGMSSGQVMQNVYMDNIRRGTMPGGYSRGGGSAANAEAARLSKAGEAKIRAGKASTEFVTSVGATQALAKKLSWDANEPQDLSGQVKFIQRYVNQFEKLMTQDGGQLPTL